MLAEDESAVLDPDCLRSHDLVRERVFQYTVLMYPGLVRERVFTDDCLIALNVHAGKGRQQPARFIYFFRVDICLETDLLVPGLDRHRNLFERCIAGTFSNSVHRALDLARPVHNARK